MSDNAVSTTEKDDLATEAQHVDNLTALSEGENHRLTFMNLLSIVSFQLGFLSDVMAVTMTGAALLTMNRDIGPSENYTWIVTSQVIGQCILTPQAGRLGDIFGRRYVLLVGNAFGMIGCAIGATANSVNTAIAGGAMIGLGGAMHQLAWAALSEVVPKRNRGLALGLFEASLLPATIFGTAIAFKFIANGSWRPVWWLCFALNSLSLVLVFFFYWPMNQYIHEEGKTAWQQIKQIDFIGFLLFAFGITLFLLGISFGGQQFPWRSAGTLAPMLIGVFLIFLLFVYSYYTNLLYAAFPKEIFRNVRGVTVVLFGVFLYGMAYYGTALLWPQQVQTLYSQDPSTIGWYGAAIGCGSTTLTPAIAWIFRRFGHSNIMLPVLLAILTTVCGACAIVSPTSNVGSTALTVLIGGLVGAISVITTAVVQVSVDHEFIGVATGLIGCIRTLGGSVATTVYSTILRSRLQANLVTDVALPLAKSGLSPPLIPGVVGALAVGDLTNPALAVLTPQMLQIAAGGLQQAYAHSFKTVFLASIAFGATATIILCFSLNADVYMTREVAITLEEGAHVHDHTDTGKGHIIRHTADSSKMQVA